MTLDDVKQIEYVVEDGIMIVHLHKPQVIKGFNTKTIHFKVSYDVFKQKLHEFNKHKNIF